ncbi:Pgc-1 And Err-Induced Regulator In Muscle Protein 1 [Manis pentadactyla]|nr:Pgc-1 And Err-Induced Regulator In Muscle Protein 1 [Manis pentadactyla]
MEDTRLSKGVRKEMDDMIWKPRGKCGMSSFQQQDGHSSPLTESPSFCSGSPDAPVLLAQSPRKRPFSAPEWPSASLVTLG